MTNTDSGPIPSRARATRRVAGRLALLAVLATPASAATDVAREVPFVWDWPAGLQCQVLYQVDAPGSTGRAVPIRARYQMSIEDAPGLRIVHFLPAEIPSGNAPLIETRADSMTDIAQRLALMPDLRVTTKGEFLGLADPDGHRARTRAEFEHALERPGRVAQDPALRDRALAFFLAPPALEADAAHLWTGLVEGLAGMALPAGQALQAESEQHVDALPGFLQRITTSVRVLDRQACDPGRRQHAEPQADMHGTPRSPGSCARVLQSQRSHPESTRDLLRAIASQLSGTTQHDIYSKLTSVYGVDYDLLTQPSSLVPSRLTITRTTRIIRADEARPAPEHIERRSTWWFSCTS